MTLDLGTDRTSKVQATMRRKWQSTPEFSPGKSHGQRNLAGYVHGVTRESDMT